MYILLKSFFVSAAMIALSNASAIERQPSSVAPSCGGDQAVCCTGSYNLEGEAVSNCITCTCHPMPMNPGYGIDQYRCADRWCMSSSIQRILLLHLCRSGRSEPFTEGIEDGADARLNSLVPAWAAFTTTRTFGRTINTSLDAGVPPRYLWFSSATPVCIL